jgi:hypothetical protein
MRPTHSDHVSRNLNCSISAHPTCAGRIGTVALKQVLVVRCIEFSAKDNCRAFLSSLMFSSQSVDWKFQGLKPCRLIHFMPSLQCLGLKMVNHLLASGNWFWGQIECWVFVHLPSLKSWIRCHSIGFSSWTTTRNCLEDIIISLSCGCCCSPSSSKQPSKKRPKKR